MEHRQENVQGKDRQTEDIQVEDIQVMLDEAQAVVFDIGNVLIAWAWEDYLKSLDFDAETYEHVANAMFRNEDWDAGDSGLVTTERWLGLFIENDPAYEEQIRYTFEHFGGAIVPYAFTKPWTLSLKQKKKRIYFLSNYSEEMYRQSKDQLDFLSFFDGGVFSWEEKCMKPDGRIYKTLIDRYRLTPEKCLFFDDRMENVEGARRAGMKAVLFHTDIPLQLWEKSCKI